ncbi:MAG TPA: ATP-binding protein [Solirubrobacterales bacterium]|nr:ATP-binding protein [Solirubrobacterales bacterium]
MFRRTDNRPPRRPSGRRRVLGVRLYLALAFAAVAVITAGIAFLVVSDSGERAADEEVTSVAVGRAVRLADELSARPRRETEATVAGFTEEDYAAWVFSRSGELITPRVVHGVDLDLVPNWRRAVRASLNGRRYIDVLEDAVTISAVRILRDAELGGTVLTRSSRSAEVEVAIEAARGDRLTALAFALAVAVLLSFLIASAITTRVKRLADSAARLTEGRLDEPLEGTGGRDEITDLGRSLETMREALRGTFSALRSERDRLSAIFDALGEAVMVVDPATGEIRFSNPSAADLITSEGTVIDPLVPWFRRAQHRGSAEHDALLVGDRVYSINAREVPAEGAVLAVVRDRTDELRREVAEREFVSNAAHELRNPIAALSGAIEVLRAGAKDDPEAREHFLGRLSDDVDRITRLTESLLMLARMEAVGEGGTEVLDLSAVVADAADAVRAPEGIETEVEVEDDLLAEGDPVLLRQVVVGLLTNAYKHTPPPGKVRVIARRDAEGQVVVEVADTGPGISAEEVDRIFERFYRASGALEKAGFGLGLSIAKRMVDVMGGEIGVDSEPGVGSTFWVRLPVAKPAATPVA